MKDDTQEDDRRSDVTNSEEEESSGEEEEEERGPTPNAKRNDPFADWDNGEPLTPEECAQLMKLSTYERAREMNIRRRRHMEADGEIYSRLGELKCLWCCHVRSHRTLTGQ